MTHVSRFPGNRPGEADESAPAVTLSSLPLNFRNCYDTVEQMAGPERMGVICNRAMICLFSCCTHKPVHMNEVSRKECDR